MKKAISVLFITILMLLSGRSFGQAYIVTAANDVLVSPTEYEFDIILSPGTAGTFEFGSLQVAIYFENSIKNGGTLTGLYIAGTSQLTNSSQYPNNPNLAFVSGSKGQLRIAPKAPPGAGNGTVISGPTRFGRFRITNTAAYLGSAAWEWNFTSGTGQYVNVHSVYVGTTNTNVTPTTSYIMNLTSDPLPVELNSFTVKNEGRDVSISWETKSETNTSVFQIERASEQGSWLKVGEVAASGNSSSPKEYSFTDKRLNSGKYSYRLKMIDNDGSYEYSEAAETEVALPKEYAISQNYPNPFNPTTRIDYQLPFDSKVTLELYGITGEKVGMILNEEQSAGYYTAEINASGLNLASGVYIYRMSASSTAGQNFVQVKKLVLMK